MCPACHVCPSQEAAWQPVKQSIQSQRRFKGPVGHTAYAPALFHTGLEEIKSKIIALKRRI